MTDIPRLRKRPLEADAAASGRAANEIDIAGCATVSYSSEDPAHPVEHLLDGQSGPGATRWMSARRYHRAHRPGIRPTADDLAARLRSRRGRPVTHRLRRELSIMRKRICPLTSRIIHLPFASRSGHHTPICAFSCPRVGHLSRQFLEKLTDR